MATQRQNPEAKITMRLAPQANTVDTMITPERYSDFGSNKTKTALQTVDELKTFLNSASTVNETMLQQASQTAEQEYLQNKTDWKAFSDKHPFMSHLNPHIQDSFAKVKADEQINAIAGEFQAKVANRPDMDEKEFQSLLYQTKQSMYQTATQNGVTNYDLEKSIVPKLNQMEQQSNASYYSTRAKYKYETVKSSHVNSLQSTWDLNQGKDLATKIKALQAASDSYTLDLNPLDMADNIQKFVQTELYSESQNMLYNPKDLTEAIKNIKINGKSVSEIDTEAMAKIYKAADDYTGRRTYMMKQQQELEDFKREQSRKDIEDRIINDALKLDPDQFNQVLNQYSGEIKKDKLGTESLQLVSDLYQFNRIRYGLAKGANENNLSVLSGFIDQAAGGGLNRTGLIKAVNKGLITQDTAEGLMSRDASERRSNQEKNENKYITKAINTNLTVKSFDTELQALGVNFDITKVDPKQWSIINTGRSQWIAENLNNYNKGILSKDVTPVIQRRKELAQAIYDQLYPKKPDKPGHKFVIDNRPANNPRLNVKDGYKPKGFTVPSIEQATAQYNKTHKSKQIANNTNYIDLEH